MSFHDLNQFLKQVMSNEALWTAVFMPSESEVPELSGVT